MSYPMSCTNYQSNKILIEVVIFGSTPRSPMAKSWILLQIFAGGSQNLKFCVYGCLFVYVHIIIFSK